METPTGIIGILIKLGLKKQQWGRKIACFFWKEAKERKKRIMDTYK